MAESILEILRQYDTMNEKIEYMHNIQCPVHNQPACRCEEKCESKILYNEVWDQEIAPNFNGGTYKKFTKKLMPPPIQKTNLDYLLQQLQLQTRIV
jgi:hypothetical protein